MLSDRCPVLSVLFLTLVHCGQTVGWIKLPLDTEVGLGPGDIVLDEGQAPPSPQEGAQQPPLLARVYCGQTVEPISETAEVSFFGR